MKVVMWEERHKRNNMRGATWERQHRKNDNTRRTSTLEEQQHKRSNVRGTTQRVAT
jgi:hypothetical protein